ncbi:MAG: dihydrofolate reductase family protein [Acidobacteria bacterium]|nr:dihydrofolate reductase family protein [Acidobacteriota bacterium]
MTRGDAMTEQMDRVAALRERGAVVVDAGSNMADAVRALLPFEVSSVLVEGGACVHRALLDAHVVDQINLVVSTRRLGPGGVPAFGTGDLRLRGFAPARIEQLGPDTWMEFHVHGHH